jgi:hypothetical protein
MLSARSGGSHDRCAIKAMWQVLRDLGESRKGHNFAPTKLMTLAKAMWQRFKNMLASYDFFIRQPISRSTIVPGQLCRLIYE